MVCSIVFPAESGLGDITGVVAFGVIPGVERVLLIRRSGFLASDSLGDGVVVALTGRRVAVVGFGSGGRFVSASPNEIFNNKNNPIFFYLNNLPNFAKF